MSGQPGQPAAPPPVVSSTANATFGLWFPTFRFLARTLPLVWLARLAEVTAERAMWEREHVQDAILENTSRVLGLPKYHRKVEEVGREMLRRHSRQWIDLVRYSEREGLDPSVLVTSRRGEDGLVAAVAGGKGAIMLTAHVGNFELGGLFLKGLGMKNVSAVYARDPSPVVEEHRALSRARLGVKGIEVTSSPFASVPILRALEEGGIVAMQGDRDVSGTGFSMPFFGERASFPAGPFFIAQQAEVPVFPAFVLQQPDGFSYRIVIEDPIRVERARGAAREPAVRTALASFVAVMERLIRENPEQWYRFEPFWETA